MQVIQCHLDPSSGHLGVAAISLFLKDSASQQQEQEDTGGGQAGGGGGQAGGGRQEESGEAEQYRGHFCSWLGNLPGHLVSLANLTQVLDCSWLCYHTRLEYLDVH